MDNNEINSVILKIYDEQKKTNKQIGGMQEQIGKMQDQMGGMQDQMGGMQDQMGGMQDQIEKMQDQIGGMQDKIGGLENKYDGLQGQVIKLREQVSEMQVSVNEIPEIKKELGTLSGRVAVIEKEHGEKLQILLDVVTGNSEKSEDLERRIERNEKIINRHSDEIYYLQQKVQNG